MYSSTSKHIKINIYLQVSSSKLLWILSKSTRTKMWSNSYDNKQPNSLSTNILPRVNIGTYVYRKSIIIAKKLDKESIWTNACQSWIQNSVKLTYIWGRDQLSNMLSSNPYKIYKDDIQEISFKRSIIKNTNFNLVFQSLNPRIIFTLQSVSRSLIPTTNPSTQNPFRVSSLIMLDLIQKSHKKHST